MIKLEKKNFILILTAVALSAVIAVMAGFLLFCKIMNIAFVPMGQYKQTTDLAKKYAKLSSIQTKMNTEGLKKVSVDDEMDAVYKGLVSSLDDPYSEYFTAEEAKEWDKYVNGTFSGIGVVFQENKDGDAVIVRVMTDSPAQVAGIKDKDIIKKVDGKTFQSQKELKNMVKGKSGTKVKLTILRKGVEKEITVTRGEVNGLSVSWAVLKGKLGYIRIEQFSQTTAEEFNDAVSTLKKKNLKGLIIDLRQNGGGYFEQGIQVADALLPEGTIVYSTDRNGKKEYYNSKEGSIGMKYVLLVDGNTASTSEMLAAAVKDNKGGKIVGTRTYGKGVSQKEYKFEDGSALKLTTAQYYSPKGHAINKKGVKPDYKVKLDLKSDKDAQLEKAMKLLK